MTFETMSAQTADRHVVRAQSEACGHLRKHTPRAALPMSDRESMSSARVTTADDGDTVVVTTTPTPPATSIDAFWSAFLEVESDLYQKLPTEHLIRLRRATLQPPPETYAAPLPKPALANNPNLIIGMLASLAAIVFVMQANATRGFRGTLQTVMPTPPNVERVIDSILNCRR